MAISFRWSLSLWQTSILDADLFVSSDKDCYLLLCMETDRENNQFQFGLDYENILLESFFNKEHQGPQL